MLPDWAVERYKQHQGVLVGMYCLHCRVPQVPKPNPAPGLHRSSSAWRLAPSLRMCGHLAARRSILKKKVIILVGISREFSFHQISIPALPEFSLSVKF